MHPSALEICLDHSKAAGRAAAVAQTHPSIATRRWATASVGVQHR